MIDGLLILLFFQFLGEVVIRLTGLPLPAPVLGMVLLLIALLLNAPFSQRVAPAAGTLIKHISLLIFPLGVGIVLQWDRYQENALALVVAVVGGTILSMILVTLMLKFLMGGKHQEKGDGHGH
ncbi:MAG: CidA/LrgA family protein [Alcanivorax sediminis]|uniref:CidA/LrgA family protein n=1 Tax=Alcanivorax sediminis TaxID=2663008 RepID=A0A6N7LS58_9GAMM|nr:CidA/LrgA family protein [Alcanivorax sediminis]MQX51835.1 CidA/LrgA family protein [Alcanivorax sediminis]